MYSACFYSKLPSMANDKGNIHPRLKFMEGPFSARLCSYLRFLAWFIGDVWALKPSLVIMVLVTAVSGVIFQLLAFGFIIYYARHFSAGTEIILAGYAADPRSSPLLLAGGSLLVTLLLTLSALSLHRSRRSSLRVARFYEEHCAKRLFRLLGRGPGLFTDADGEVMEERALLRLARQDSRLAGRAVHLLSSAIIPLLTLLVSLVVLLYLEPLLTCGIGLLSLIFLFHQYRVSQGVAVSSVRFERTAPVAGRELNLLIGHIKQQVDHDPEGKMVERIFSRGPVKRELDAFEERMAAVVDSKMGSALFMALILGVIILVMGFEIIGEKSGWGRMLVYVVVLRFAMVSLQPCFGAITSINRFYPQIRRYVNFVRSCGLELSHGPPPENYHLTATGDGDGEILAGSLKEMDLVGGERLALLTPYPLHHYTLGLIVRSLVGDGAVLRNTLPCTRFADGRSSCPPNSLRRFLGLGPAERWGGLREWFPDPDLWSRAEELFFGGMDRRIDPDLWNELEPEVRMILELIAAHRSSCRWLLVAARGVRLIGPDLITLLERFRQQVVMVVFNLDDDLERVGDLGEEGVVVAGSRVICGMGSVAWFSGVRREMEERLRDSGEVDKGGIATGEVDMDDDPAC